MTQRQSAILKAILPWVGTIFMAGVAWRDLKGDIRLALPSPRFEAESIRNDGAFEVMIRNQVETKDALLDIKARLLEVCIAVRSGCR
jgi:hypothetical protein